MAWLHSTHSLIYAQVTTGEALHPLTVERLAPQLLGNDASAPLPLPDYTAYVRGVFEKLEPVWKAPDNSSLSHFSAMARPSWLGRAVRNRHRHAIEQASHRWRGGRSDDSNAP